MKAAVQGIPELAVKRGVYPEDALRERFLQVRIFFPFRCILDLSTARLRVAIL